MPETIAAKDAYKRGIFTDCIIKCQGQVLRCHKLVLCAHSELFAAAFTGSFKEATNDTIELHDESPDELSAFLDILYGCVAQEQPQVEIKHDECTGSWDIPPECSVHGVEDFKDLIHKLDAHVSMYALADRLSAPVVKEHSVSGFKFQLRCYRCVNVTLAILSSNIVQDIYNTTPESAREIRDLISKYLEFDLQVTVRSSHFPEVLQQADGFAMDMMVLAAERHGGTGAGYVCCSNQEGGRW